MSNGESFISTVASDVVQSFVVSAELWSVVMLYATRSPIAEEPLSEHSHVQV
jgi:hypothetical protein